MSKNDLVVIYKLLKRIKGKSSIYLISTVAISFRSFLISLLTGLLFSEILVAAQRQSVESLKKGVLTFLTFLILFTVSDSFFMYLQSRVLLDIENTFRKLMVKKMYSAPFFQIMAVGQKSTLLSRINEDVSLVRNIFGSGILNPVLYFFSGAGAIMVIGNIAPIFIIWSCIIGGVSVVSNSQFGRLRKHIFEQIQEIKSEVLRHFNEALTYNMSIRLGSIVPGFLQRMERSIAQRYTISLKNAKYEAVVSSIGTLEGALKYGGTIMLGILFYKRGQIQLSEIMILTQMVGLVVVVFTSIGSSLVTLQESLVGIKRIFDILDIEEERQSGFDVVSKNIDQKELFKFENLSISYKESKNVLNNLNGDIKPNKITYINGPSGSGKSSLLKILMGFLPYQGSIKLYGKELTDYKISELRTQIAYVPQEPTFFDGTLAENLLIDQKQSIDDVEIANVLELVCLKEVIFSLPEGLHTYIDSKKIFFSGGQMQCLSLARALLSDKPILLLDETFSAMDIFTREKIFQNMELLLVDKTIILVSHFLEDEKKKEVLALY